MAIRLRRDDGHTFTVRPVRKFTSIRERSGTTRIPGQITHYEDDAGGSYQRLVNDPQRFLGPEGEIYDVVK